MKPTRPILLSALVLLILGGMSSLFAQAPLPGAVFGLEPVGAEGKYTRLVTDANGFATSAELSDGEYRVFFLDRAQKMEPELLVTVQGEASGLTAVGPAGSPVQFLDQEGFRAEVRVQGRRILIAARTR